MMRFLGAAACFASLLVADAASAQELALDDRCRPAPELARELAWDDEEPVGIYVEGTDAYLWGTITDAFPCKIDYLLTAYPWVDTLVLEYIPGSMDDEMNFAAGLRIHRAGLATYVLSDSELYSGGVDLFLAGVRRSGEPGAIFGVHGWSDSAGFEARDIPRDGPEHDRYLDYFRAIGIPADFYWFTVDAAPADDMHIMSEAELERFDFFTD